MLTCVVGIKNINILNNDYDKYTLKTWSNKGLLKCPVCNGTYEYCHGDIVSPYFRHIGKECTFYYHENETEEHRKGKILLYNWLKDQNGISNLKLEAWLPETKQRPDIYFEYNNQKYVIEYQCTPIATEYLKRKELYKLSGITDIWILGTEKYNVDKHIYDRYKVIEKELNKSNQLVYLNVNTNQIYLHYKHKCFIDNEIFLYNHSFTTPNDVIEYLKETCEKEWNTISSQFIHFDISTRNSKDLYFSGDFTLSDKYSVSLKNIIITVVNKIKEKTIADELEKEMKLSQINDLYMSLKYKDLVTVNAKTNSRYDFSLKFYNSYFFFFNSDKVDFCRLDVISKKFSRFINLSTLSFENLKDNSIKQFIDSNMGQFVKEGLNE